MNEESKLMISFSDGVNLNFHFEAGFGILQLRSDVVLENVPEKTFNLMTKK
jgi:hypothetical protein